MNLLLLCTKTFHAVTLIIDQNAVRCAYHI